MDSQQNTGIVNELETFRKELDDYHYYRILEADKKATKKQIGTAYILREKLLQDAGKFRRLITELTGKEKVQISSRGKDYSEDMWLRGLELQFGFLTAKTLYYCIDVTTQAVGMLQSDVEKGRRDKFTGELITTPDSTTKQKVTELTAKADWKDIENEYGITKKAFGKEINFVSDRFRRNIIFRDVEHASFLASTGFSKPAVILAGGVIEELLRLYLEFRGFKPIKDDFDGYIKTCEQEGLLKAGIYRLSDSARHFRNLVHLSKEETKRHTVSKSAAKGAVASIFTIANDF